MTLPFKSSVIVCVTLGFTAQALGQVQSLSEQNQSEVTVIITDSEGRRIPGAEVVISSESAGTEIHERTNDQGQAVVKLASDEYKVTAKKLDFKWSIAIIRIQPPAPLHLTVQIRPGETRTTSGPDNPDVPLEPVQLPDLLVQEKRLSSEKSIAFDRLSPRWMSPQSGLKQRLRQLAGNDALNCGHASQSLLPATNVTECALQEYGSGKRFYARFELDGGIDVVSEVGFAYDGRKVYVVTSSRGFTWDGDDPPYFLLQVYKCPLPTKLAKTQSGGLDCFVADPSSRPKLLQTEPGY